MTKPTKGQLAEKPVAELIREIGEASVSGALRLARDRAKAVVYFENGDVAFAASNIRAHRLLEFLKRTRHPGRKRGKRVRAKSDRR